MTFTEISCQNFRVGPQLSRWNKTGWVIRFSIKPAIRVPSRSDKVYCLILCASLQLDVQERAEEINEKFWAQAEDGIRNDQDGPRPQAQPPGNRMINVSGVIQPNVKRHVLISEPGKRRFKNIASDKDESGVA